MFQEFDLELVPERIPIPNDLVPEDPIHDPIPEVFNDHNLAAFEGLAQVADALP